MGEAQPPQKVKLVIACIFKDTTSFARAKGLLVKKFGPLDFAGGPFPFNATDYYQKEMGNALNRAFLSFTRLILPEKIASIKTYTNRIEKKLSYQTKRTVNIDPGYLTLAKLVLATTKDYSHRIYLNHGIFAEVTLIYQDKSFKAGEYTYPDFRSQEYIHTFNHIRSLYHTQLP